MECLLCGQPFDAEDDAAMVDEMLAHLQAAHPAAIDAMEEWPSYEQWVDEAEDPDEDG